MTQAAQGHKHGRNQLIWLFLAFLIPIVAAKLLLGSGFRGEVATHGGHLLADKLSYQSLALDNPAPGTWQMLYIANEGCNESCYNRLHYLQKTWQALGRLQERVNIVLATDNRLAGAAPDFIDLNLVQILELGPVQQLPYNQQVVIVDPLGNLVMLFTLPDDQQQSLVIAHNMLLDIKQLLKLSRIG